MDLLNEELNYRISSGENIRGALLSGSRIYDASEEQLFSYIDTQLSFVAGERLAENTNTDWDLLAAYAAAISEWRQQGTSIQAQTNALDRQIEMAKLIQKGGKWDAYYNEPFDVVNTELAASYQGLKNQRIALNQFIVEASEAELQAYANLRSTIGEGAAMQEVMNTRRTASNLAQ